MTATTLKALVRSQNRESARELARQAAALLERSASLFDAAGGVTFDSEPISRSDIHSADDARNAARAARRIGGA